MTTVKYNGIDIASGLSPTPLLGRQVDVVRYGDRWGQVETITLKGQLTGNCYSYSDWIAAQTTFVGRFGSDFKGFEIYDDSNLVFARSGVKVNSIDFDQSNYSYFLPYTVTLQAYPSGYFSGVYGVLEPSNNYSYTDRGNYVIGLEHSVSAKGFNTHSSTNNALSNAKSWVQSQTGLAGKISPAFLNYTGQQFCLSAQRETVNRLTSAYAVDETYSVDISQSGAGILRFTVELSQDVDSGITSVSVRGNLVGCKNGSIDILRARYATFSAFNEALKVYMMVTGSATLNQLPTQKGVSEDIFSNTISFSFVFDDDLSPATNFDYKASFEYDIESDIVTASIEGTISSRLPIQDRWAAINSLANSIDLFSIILPLYNTYAASLGITYPLNKLNRSYSRTENRNKYTLTLSARFDNSAIPPLGLDLWEYSLNVKPALRRYAESPCLDGQGSYVVFDLGYSSRRAFTIEGRAIASPNLNADQALSIIKAECVNLKNQYANGNRQALEGQAITKSNAAFGRSVSVSAKYSCESDPFTIS